jgi:hypothetical protein
MNKSYRQQVLGMLDRVQSGCQEASRTPADLPAYMHRLLKHLFLGQEKVISSTMHSTMDDLLSFTANTLPSEESARQTIQAQLWSRRPSQSFAVDDRNQSSSSHMSSASHPQDLRHSGHWTNHPDTISPSSEFQMQANGHSLLFPSTDDEFW